MGNVTEIFQAFLALGATVILSVFIFTISFVGINLVVGLLVDNLDPAAQVVMSRGCRVVMTGLTQDAARLKIARERFGVEFTVDVQKDNLDGLIDELTDGYGGTFAMTAEERFLP